MSIRHLRGLGELLADATAHDADYHLLVQLDDDGEPVEFGGTVVSTPGLACEWGGRSPLYVLVLDDGTRVACRLGLRDMDGLYTFTPVERP